MGEKECFVISPIGDEGSPTREWADNVFNHIIEPAVRSYEYEPIRSDHISDPGIITSQIMEKVVESPLVIADLTNQNANVFYELAIRHAIQEPVIQMIDSSQNIPFDVAATRVIQVDSGMGSSRRAEESVRDQIDSIESGESRVDTPISRGLNREELLESSDPEARSLGEITESLSEIRSDIFSIKRIANQGEFRRESEYDTIVDYREITRYIDTIEQGLESQKGHLKEIQTVVDLPKDDQAQERIEVGFMDAFDNIQSIKRSIEDIRGLLKKNRPK